MKDRNPRPPRPVSYTRGPYNKKNQSNTPEELNRFASILERVDREIKNQVRPSTFTITVIKEKKIKS